MSEADTRSRGFIFTMNNPTKTPFEMITHFKKQHVKKAVFQLERGREGTPHYQGYIYYGNARFERAVSKEFKFWCQPAVNDQAVRNYVTKDATKEEGPWGYGVPGVENPEEEIDIITDLRPWQKEVEELVAETCHDNRTIYWYWEPQGNMGKTALAKYLVVKHGAFVLSGKAADCKAAIAKRKEKGKTIPGIMVFHYTRTNEHFVSYEALEAIKDGIFFSGKYESDMVVYNCPHVIVMANFPPDYTKLSGDRWKVVQIAPNV